MVVNDSNNAVSIVSVGISYRTNPRSLANRINVPPGLLLYLAHVNNKALKLEQQAREQGSEYGVIVEYSTTSGFIVI